MSDAVLGVLARSPEIQGKTWNVSHDNVFAADWLVNSPLQPIWGRPSSALVYPEECQSNCDPDFALQLCTTQSDCTNGGICAPVRSSVTRAGEAPKSMCVGHSMEMVDKVYDIIAGAERFADVTSLSPADDQFKAAIRNAITFASQKPNPPVVRIVTSEIPIAGRVNTKTETKFFTRDLSRSSNIKVSVGAYRSSNTQASWNHSKIIAADGKVALVGGHNMWSKQYLSRSPVNDTSVLVRGTAAADAHRYVNQLWDYVCTASNWQTWLTWSVWGNTWVKGSVTNDCPAQFTDAAPEGPPTGTVISVGRLGAGIQSDANQADDARLALMGAAKKTLRIVQQDIGPITVPYLGLPLMKWPAKELNAIGQALVRGVDVYIIVSQLNATAGGLPITVAMYSNNWKPEEVRDQIRKSVESIPGAPSGAALDQLLCAKLHVAPFRYNETESTWPDGTPFANHTKIVQVDGQGLYVTSHNMYPANLQEYGYIIDDSRISGSWLSQYWASAWKYSSTAAVSGPEAPACQGR